MARDVSRSFRGGVQSQHIGKRPRIENACQSFARVKHKAAYGAAAHVAISASPASGHATSDPADAPLSGDAYAPADLTPFHFSFMRRRKHCAPRRLQTRRERNRSRFVQTHEDNGATSPEPSLVFASVHTAQSRRRSEWASPRVKSAWRMPSRWRKVISLLTLMQFRVFSLGWNKQFGGRATPHRVV